MSKFEPVIFIPASSKPTAMKKSVTQIWTVGHILDPDEQLGNHWTFYLEISGEKESVQPDMSPSHTKPSTTIKGGSKGILIISSLDRQTSPAARCILKMQVRQNLLVEHVVDTLIEDGAHRFEFNREGTGCRAWVSQQLDLLLSKGVVTVKEEVEKVKEALVIQAPKGYHYPLTYGGYY